MCPMDCRITVAIANGETRIYPFDNSLSQFPLSSYLIPLLTMVAMCPVVDWTTIVFYSFRRVASLGVSLAYVSYGWEQEGLRASAPFHALTLAYVSYGLEQEERAAFFNGCALPRTICVKLSKIRSG